MSYVRKCLKGKENLLFRRIFLTREVGGKRSRRNTEGYGSCVRWGNRVMAEGKRIPRKLIYNLTVIVDCLKNVEIKPYEKGGRIPP